MANTSKYAQKTTSQLIKHRYEERATVMLAEAKRLEQYIRARYRNDPLHTEWVEIAKDVYEWSDRDDVWRVRFDHTCDVTTITYKGSEEEKKLGLVGTDGTRVVKLLTENSYDYVRTDDFIERAKLIFSAVLAEKPNFLKKHCASSDPEQLRQQLEQLRDSVLKKILRECELDVTKMRELNKKEREKYFIERYARAQTLLAEALVNVAQVLNRSANQTMLMQMSSHQYNKTQQEALIKQLESNLKHMITAIKHQEVAYIAAKGRPHILKVTKINDQEMLSAQFTQGELTLPSTDRSGKHAVKLSNHVLDVTGVVVSDLASQRQPESVEIQFAIAGHSSYPPIGIEDEILRQQIAVMAVKERVNAIVQDRVLQLLDQDREDQHTGLDSTHPLTIKLNTMMLLTPLLGDKESKNRKFASEYHQLLETHYAFQCVQSQGTMPIIVRGQTRYVRLDASYMNLPVNMSKNMAEVIHIANHQADHLQSRVNQQGWYEYNVNVASSLSAGFFQIIKSENPRVRAIGDLFKAYEASIHLRNNPLLAAEQVKMREELMVLKSKLSSQYKELTDLLSHYQAEHAKLTPLMKKDFQVRIKKVKEAINQDELKLNSLYIHLNDTQATLINSPSALAIANEMLNQIDKLLQEGGNISDSERNVLLQQHRVIRLQRLYLSGDYRKDQNAYHFQALYLLTNQQAGAQVEAFCKSTEGRTGWLRVVCATYSVFFHLHGRDPDITQSKDRERFNHLCAQVHNRLATSLENTAANVPGARGLLVGERLTNREIGMSLGKMTAELAKNIYEPAVLKGAMDTLVSQQLADLTKAQNKSASQNQASALRILDTFKSFIRSNEVPSNTPAVYASNGPQLFMQPKRAQTNTQEKQGATDVPLDPTTQPKRK